MNINPVENELRNLLNIFDNRGETIFFDHSHVTDKGYKILCEKICSEIYDNLKNI